MNDLPIALRAPTASLREARRRLLETGCLGESPLDPALRASWQRSHGWGLRPQGRPQGAPHASGAQVQRALEQRRTLVAHARPVMDFLAEQIRDTGSLVILADPGGMLLQSLGDAGFADRAARVALRPGAIWSEQWRGTNAIGTALVDARAAVVHGAEHYLERNAFLTCAASPVIGPDGQLLGVLDITGERRGYHRHTLALVRSGVRMIEHQLFTARHGHGLHLRLHARAEGLGTVTEGLIALSEDGWLIGATATALEMLGLARPAIGSSRVERVLGIEIGALLAAGTRAASRAPVALRGPDGRSLWGRPEVGRAGVSVTMPDSASRVRPAGPPPGDALAALDTGDAAMHAAIARARRVLDKPIALLLQGESGVGKELFARAAHRSGAQHDGPFVAVNCAALPDALVEAELFGYRPGAFTGARRDGAPGRIREAHCGTLFLDEIGDMPLALQARLLRVLQDRQVVPLGGGKPVDVSFQLICATHHNLRAAVDAGRFREDLYYRLNGLALVLPPLRERSDLAVLVAALLDEIAPRRQLALSPALAAAFAAYRWPGNMRQLANALRTACALIDDDAALIEHSHLPEDLAAALPGADAPPGPRDAGSDLRLQAARQIEAALRTSAGNVSEAARRLGISRNTLYRKRREFGGQKL